MTDLLVEMDSHKIGVSVTRAFAYPPETPYTDEMAASLLEKKLSGVLDSTANVSSTDRWNKQVLYVLAYTSDHSSRIVEVYQGLDDAIKADTILLVTTTEGEDSFLY